MVQSTGNVWTPDTFCVSIKKLQVRLIGACKYDLTLRGVDRVQAQYCCFPVLLSLRVPLRVFAEQLELVVRCVDDDTAYFGICAWGPEPSFWRDDSTVCGEYDD
jgi:hypothetical protein